MNQTIFLTFLVCVFCELNYIYGEVPENQLSRLYDVHQLALNIAEGIEVADAVDKNKDFLISNNVEDKIKLLNFLNLIPVLINSVSNVTNSSCFNDLLYIKDNIKFKNLQDSWALKMMDSFGKPESGLLEGNVKWLGDFEECRGVYAPKKVDSDIGGFRGQYCTLQVTLMAYIPLSIGVCLPDSCSSSEFKEIFNISTLTQEIKQSGLEFNVTSFKCKANELKLSGGGIATLFIVSVFFFLVFLGSSITIVKYFYDLNTTKDTSKTSTDPIDHTSKSVAKFSLEEQLDVNKVTPTNLIVFIDKCDPFLNCFCIFTNGSKLLNTDATEGQLLCLHGIRFLSMAWIILGHVYTFSMPYVRSIKEVITIVDNLPFQTLNHGSYSVDTFFLLSGFLMSYLYFQECAKTQGKIPWLYFYVHRYVRLTPVYMIVLAFLATVINAVGSGPFWPDSNVDTVCQKSWWSNLIYINNFQQTAGNQCMSWSWYLANDMQFFVISPLFLITLWRWPKVGYSISALCLGISWLSGFLITYLYKLPIGNHGDYKSVNLNDPTFLTRWNDYYNKIYLKPYTRIAPYVIGIVLGYILFKRKAAGVKFNQRTLWIGWLIAVPANLYCIYGYYHQTSTLLSASFSNSLIRSVYTFSLSWLIFVCLSGQGGIVNKILSFNLFIPLSRLTYCAYLIHPIIITIYINSLKYTIAFTHQLAVLWFLGFLAVSYAFSLVVSLTFESPLIKLEKLVRNKFK